MSKKLKDLFVNLVFDEITGGGEVTSIIYNSVSKGLLLQLSMEDVPESSLILSAAEKIKENLRKFFRNILLFCFPRTEYIIL